MSQNPYVQFYTSDFLGGTSGMTAACKGVYITLLCQMYEAEAPLGQGWDMLARRCGCTLPAFKRAISDLKDDGKIIITDDGIWSPKCEKHITLRRERHSSASSAAKKRWEKSKQKQGIGDAGAYNPQCQPEPEPEPYINDDTNVSSRRSGKDAGFSDFWEIWPSKKNKQNALKAWRKLNIESKRSAYAAIKAGWFDQWQAASPDANPIHASTFLNSRRWEDQQSIPNMRQIEGARTNVKRSIAERLEARLAQMDCGEDRNASEPLFPTSDERDGRGGGDDGLDQGVVRVFPRADWGGM
jgi:uncharacterized protein YdaU (DUF1376 family)